MEMNWTATMRLAGWRTTNKVVTEDEEQLTGYCKLTGLVPIGFLGQVTGMEQQEYEDVWWTRDGEPRHPAIDWLVLDVEAKDHVVDFASLKYRDMAATVRKIRLAPAYGKQWMAELEILIKPDRSAPIGKFAMAQHHDLDVVVEGAREPGLVEE